MARLLILTVGSRGDVQPYVALGVALKKSGAQVRIATLQTFAQFVTSYGLECYAIEGDLAGVMKSSVADNARKADNPLKLLLSFNELKKLGLALQAGLFAACQGADLVIYHPGMALGYFAAQELGIPSVLAYPVRGGRPAAPSTLVPADSATVGAVALGDVDGDGVPDLFVGARVVPGAWPLPATGRLASCSARRRRNSMCPFTLRRSSLAQRWIASSTSGSIRSRNAFRSATAVPTGRWCRCSRWAERPSRRRGRPAGCSPWRPCALRRA